MGLYKFPLPLDYKILFPLMPTPTSEQILTFAYRRQWGSEFKKPAPSLWEGEWRCQVSKADKLTPAPGWSPYMTWGQEHPHFWVFSPVLSCPALSPADPVLAFWGRSAAAWCWQDAGSEPLLGSSLASLSHGLSQPVPLNPFSTLESEWSF